MADAADALGRLLYELTDIAQEPGDLTPQQPLLPDCQAPPCFEAIMALLQRQAEQDFSAYKRMMLERRIHQRMEPCSGTPLLCREEFACAEREVLVLPTDLLDKITADIAKATQAMRSGAGDTCNRSGSHGELIGGLERSMPRFYAQQAQSDAPTDYTARRAALTQRQKTVLTMVMAGEPSKNIAADLGISQRTVESHRAQIMRRLDVRSIPELIHAVLSVGPMD